MFEDFLKCPRCFGNGSLVLAGMMYSCRQCDAYFPMVDGIVDFVQGRSDTTLNELDYDRQKGVTVQSSLDLFARVKQKANGAINGQLGNILEIGAGTGLLTTGMLLESEFERAIITDLSLRMLESCRERILANIGDKKERILFATYSAGEHIFRDSMFDLIVANSVVHHISDYRGFFEATRSFLKPGGRAVFVEPGGPYHDAMTRALADSLCYMIGNGEHFKERKIKRLAEWITLTRLRLGFPLDHAAVDKMEDKHLFFREDLEMTGRNVGFENVKVVPWFIDPKGMIGAGEYLRELGMPKKLFNRCMSVYEQYAERYFSMVDEDDTSGMYLIVMQR